MFMIHSIIHDNMYFIVKGRVINSAILIHSTSN